MADNNQIKSHNSKPWYEYSTRASPKQTTRRRNQEAEEAALDRATRHRLPGPDRLLLAPPGQTHEHLSHRRVEGARGSAGGALGAHAQC